MDPILAALRGTAITDDEMKDIGQELMRERYLGDVAQVSGDPVLSPLGKTLSRRAGRQAKDLGDVRRSAMEKLEKEMGKNDWKFRSATKTQPALWVNEKTQEYKPVEGLPEPEPDYEKLRSSDIKTLSQLGQVTNVLTGLNQELGDPEFDPGQMPVPFGRTGANIAAQYGYGTENTKQVQDWWAQFDRFYTLPERNALFGATLTPNEQQAWRAATISPEMTKEQIQGKMGRLIDIYNNVIQRVGGGLEAEGYNPEAISRYTGASKVSKSTEPTRPYWVKESDWNSLSAEEKRQLVN